MASPVRNLEHEVGVFVFVSHDPKEVYININPLHHLQDFIHANELELNIIDRMYPPSPTVTLVV